MEITNIVVLRFGGSRKEVGILEQERGGVSHQTHGLVGEVVVGAQQACTYRVRS